MTTVHSVITAPPSPTSPSPAPLSGGLLQTYLRDPGNALHDVLDHARAWLTGPGLVIVPLLLVLVLTAVVLRGWWARRCQDMLAADARLVTILPAPTVDPAGAIGLWANLVGLLRPAWSRRISGQPHVGFEYRFTSDGVQIQMWVPGVVPPGMVERAVEAAWPGTHTTTTHLVSTGGANASINKAESLPAPIVTGGQLRLAHAEALPIRTDFDADPLRALFGAPVGLQPGEEAVVQLLARPVTGRRVLKARTAAAGLHDGRSPRLVGRLLDLITPGTSPTRRSASSRSVGVDRVTALGYHAQDRAVADKLAGAQFETLLRYAVTAPTEGARTEIRAVGDRVRGRAHAIASAFAVYSGHNHYLRRRLRHPEEVIAARRFGRRGDLLSIPELAALAHLPTDQAVVGLTTAGARAVAPPPAVPTPTSATLATVKPLGAADTGHRRLVGLTVADSRQHLHVLGATGVGKSTLLGQLILADAQARRGVVVIDPKGDLVTDLLDRLPAEAAERVVLFDADSSVRPPCMNPLDNGPAESSVDNLTSIFARVYAQYWGPRTDDVLRAACLTLRAQPGTATLAQLPALLAEPATRARAVARVQDPVLRGFWDWYEQLSPGAQAQAVAPLLNKLRAFLLRPFVRDAIAAGPSTLNMRTVLDNGGICLVRIPKGSLGEDTTKLVGSLVVASVWQNATARAAVAQADRADCGMYVDECQNFLNLPYPLEDMLAEARGFRLSMTLAHQHLGQLGRELKDGISANARNKVFFNASPEDARELSRHTAPRLSEHDLAHLPGYHAAARLLVNGAETPPFTLTTTPLTPAVKGRARALRAAAARNAHPGTSPPVKSPRTSTNSLAVEGDPRRR